MRYINPLLFLLLVIVGMKVSDSAYRWVVYGPERAKVRELRPRVVDAGAQIIRTRQESDSMRAVLHAEDAALESEEKALHRYELQARGRNLPQDVYERYRRDLEAYNAHVESRNAKLGAWRDILDRNHAAVARYTVLSDSVRELATRMGDPYYAVPSPAEAAVERGITRSEP